MNTSEKIKKIAEKLYKNGYSDSERVYLKADDYLTRVINEIGQLSTSSKDLIRVGDLTKDDRSNGNGSYRNTFYFKGYTVQFTKSGRPFVSVSATDSESYRRLVGW